MSDKKPNPKLEARQKHLKKVNDALVHGQLVVRFPPCKYCANRMTMAREPGKDLKSNCGAYDNFEHKVVCCHLAGTYLILGLGHSQVRIDHGALT